MDASDGGIATLRCVWKKKVAAPENTERAVAALVGAGLAIRSAAPEQSTLEDVFAELTAQGEPDEREEREERAEDAS